MIEVKTNMTEAEIDEAQRKNKHRRLQALKDYKEGRRKAADTCKILDSCDRLHTMLERVRKKAKR